MPFSMQGAVERIAEITGQEVAFTRNQFRTWLASGLIPALQESGEGVGTRRIYDAAAVFVGSVLVRLSQLGMSGQYLKELGEGAVFAFEKRKDELSRKYYMVGLPKGIKALVLYEFVCSPNLEEILSQVDGGAAFIVDVHSLYRLAIEAV